MRYFLHLAYNGFSYRGWQRQAMGRTVQAVVEDNLCKMLGEKLTIHPCGRTDAGVHARQFFAHIDIQRTIDFDFIFRINKMLPNTISVFDLLTVPERANAQLDAIQRTYQYQVHFHRNPFLNTISSYYEYENLDEAKMQEAIQLILLYEDFKSMCLKPDAHNHTYCRIDKTQLIWNKKEERLYFEITANRFLRGMIRILMQNLLDIGRGKLSIEQFREALESGERVYLQRSAAPQGLFLTKVKYPFLDIPSKAGGVEF